MSRRGLEFLGQLAGGLVHEIKNPLSTVRINLTLLKEDLPDEPRLQHRVEVLEREVARLDEILADFMRYAGMRRFDKTDTDVAALVEELAEFIGPGFALDDIALNVDVAPATAAVEAGLFKQALLNLLLNAQEATARGGTVSVRARPDGGRLEFEIRDDGCGVPAADLERVFDVYYSGFQSGSGLGLPTARRIVEEHGGSLELESEEGRYTCVRFWIPCNPCAS